MPPIPRGRVPIQRALYDFDRQDDRFLSAVREANDPRELALLADRWKLDKRPWARQQMLRYLELPWDRPGHQPVIKRLFKQAEQHGDDELMALLAVGLDRLVRRTRARYYERDPQTRQFVQVERLTSPGDVIPSQSTEPRTFRNPRTGEKFTVTRPVRPPRHGRLFSYHTRHYLRRRVWRYFRRMAIQRPQDYPLAIARALVRYRDDDLRRGENILDSRTLMQACFGTHDALEFGTARVWLREGRTLAELTPAPRFAELWRRPESLDVLLMLLAGAKSRLVRVWSRELLQREHADGLAQVHPDDLIELVQHEDEEVRRFGVERFASAQGLDALPADSWFRLFQATPPTLLETATEAMRRHVSAARLPLEDCVRLACADPEPVARLGLELLRERPPATVEERQLLTRLAEARCAEVARELTGWALTVLGQPDVYDRGRVQPFFDSPSRPVRETAGDWLRADSPGARDAALWNCLVASPHADVRQRVVDALTGPPGAMRPPDEALVSAWQHILADPQFAGRHKQRAVQQAAAIIQRHPATADVLLPALAGVLRSERPAQWREVLAMIVQLAESRPELIPSIERLVPELRFAPAHA